MMMKTFNPPEALLGPGPRNPEQRSIWERARRSWCELNGITVADLRAMERQGPATALTVPVALMRRPWKPSSLPAWEQARRNFAAEQGVTIEELDALTEEWRATDDGTFVECR